MEENEITTKKDLKTYFETGDRPTENQFSELIDSYWHKGEKIPKEKIEGLENLSLDYDLQWSPTNKKLSLIDSKGNLVSDISLQTLDDEGTDLRYNSATLSLELYSADNELLDSIPVADFVRNVGTQLALNSNTLQLKDSQGNILSNINFNVSNINNLQTLLDSKLDKPTMTRDYVGKWNGNNFVNGILQDYGTSAGIGNNNYENIIWAVDSTTQAALIAPKMTQVQRLAITLDSAQTGAVVYQTDGSAGYYLWNGNSWETMGSNIATSDLTNIQPRTFTQNAEFTWNTLGNAYYLKGLTDQTGNLAQYKKVLRMDPITKQIAMGDSFDVAVTIPDSLTINAPAMNVNYTVNHVYPDPVSPLPQNLIDLKNFMATIATNQYTRIEDSQIIFQKIDSADRGHFSNGVAYIRSGVENNGNEYISKCSFNLDVLMPHDKNWILYLSGNLSPHADYARGLQIGFSRTSSSLGVQQPEIGTLKPHTTNYGLVGYGISAAKYYDVKPTVVYTKVGEVLNITVAYSDGTIYSVNTDAQTFLGDYRFVITSGDYSNIMYYPSFSNLRYYIAP